MQPRIQLAFRTGSTHCQLMYNFSSTSSPKPFSSCLLQIPLSPTSVDSRGGPDPGALGLEPREFHTSTLLEVVQVPLDVIPPFRHVNHTNSAWYLQACSRCTQLLYINDEHIKQYWVNSAGLYMDP